MSESINVYKNPISANIKQTRIKRQWMDETDRSHAYHCFPVTLANTLGYEISFPEEISFIWDGISDSKADHVKVLKGSKYASSSRGNATISLNTGLTFKSSENITMLHMPVPNYFIDGVQAFTTLVSTSFFKNPMPAALMVTRPNEVITIPANQPIITLLPIPLKMISEINMDIYPNVENLNSVEYNKEYSKAAYEINKVGNWTDWYRNTTDHTGEKIGSHEVKTIKLTINDYTK